MEAVLAPSKPGPGLGAQGDADIVAVAALARMALYIEPVPPEKQCNGMPPQVQFANFLYPVDNGGAVATVGLLA